MSDYFIGVDLGGTKVEACCLDDQGNLLSRNRVLVEADHGLEVVIGNILKVIEKAADGKQIEAVGIGCPGTYLADQDLIYGVPHTPIYEERGFIQRIKSILQVPVIVENDANCLALAEYYATCKGIYKYVMAVIIGTGMGYGLILNEKLYRGSVGGAGEIGHTTIDYRGRHCECGRQGCAEAYLSGPSISRRYSEISGEKIDTYRIYQRFLAGDHLAQEVFETSCEIMGNVFANVINSLDLEAIILGGGVSNIPIWYERVPFYVHKLMFGPPRGEIPIIKAKLGDSAGVVGAGYLALRELGKMDF